MMNDSKEYTPSPSKPAEKSTRPKKTPLKKLSNSQKERLIEYVKLNPILWNKRAGGFSMPQSKLKVWDLIAQELHIPRKHATRHWKALFDNYRERYNKYIPSGSGATVTINWKWAPLLSFLNSSLELRPTVSNRDSDEHDNKSVHSNESLLQSGSRNMSILGRQTSGPLLDSDDNASNNSNNSGSVHEDDMDRSVEENSVDDDAARFSSQYNSHEMQKLQQDKFTPVIPVVKFSSKESNVPKKKQKLDESSVAITPKRQKRKSDSKFEIDMKNKLESLQATISDAVNESQEMDQAGSFGMMVTTMMRSMKNHPKYNEFVVDMVSEYTKLFSDLKSKYSMDK